MYSFCAEERKGPLTTVKVFAYH